MRRGALLSFLLAVLTLGWVGAAQAGTAAAAETCSGVWVVVDYGDLGGSTTACATSYGTGAAALRSAGLSPTLENGMVTKISGKPGTVDLNKNYWSYWHATAKADGSYSNWSYSTLGATAYHPTAGNAEGWRYQGLNEGKVPPAASPPKGTPAPSPTPTSAKPTPKPSATATKKPTPKPSVTASPTKSASASTSAAASATASAKPDATGTASGTPTPTAVATFTRSEPTTAEAQAQVSEPSPTSDNGSPVGAIAVGAVVVAVGAGAGGWWLLKGRRR